MKIRGHTTTVVALPLALAAMMLPGMGTNTVYAQAKGMGAPPSKVEMCIQDPSATVGERHAPDCASSEFSGGGR
jgi:hypothetical protein